MSEVLSGSDVRSGRFTIFPTDERQSLRLGRFLMAAGTSLLICLALCLFAFLNLLPWHAALEGTAGIVTLARGEEVQAVLARADKALYQAKAAGRNQVMALG